MSRARTVAVAEPRDPAGLVLVLHGGGAREQDVRVSPAQLSVLRMVPVARRVARAGRGRLAVHRLLNSTRGWDTRHTPVDDVDQALEQLGRAHPGVPVGLVGHSLGGRAALLAGDRDAVRSVVALNPYVLPQDRPRLDGRHVLVVHGDQDRIARLGLAAALVRTLGPRVDAGFVTVTGGKHAMLRRGGTYERLAADFTAAVLLGRTPTEPLVQQVLDGASGLTA